MRLPFFLIGLALVSACATPPPPPIADVLPVTDREPPSRAEQLLSSAGRERAATRAEIESALGEPDIARQDGAGSALTYRLPTCALLLLFIADGENVQRLAEAHAGTRRAGEPAPSLQQCAAEASQR